LPIDLSVNVKTFSQSKKHKTFGLDEHDIQQVCTWIRSNNMKKRERAMLALLLFQGLRQCEICRLKICYIKLNEGVFFVHGKGRDDKEAVFMHPNTQKLLAEYLRTSPINLKTGNAYLFQSLRQQSNSMQLTERGLRKIIEGILHDIGVYKNVHGFRHYFTSQLIRTMPGELTNVAAFTRHRSLGQLQVYNDNIIQHQQLSKYVSAFEALAV
jgi:integrase/recombinase XerC